MNTGAADGEGTRTGKVAVSPLVWPVKRSLCDPAAVPRGIVSVALISPLPSAMTVPRKTGIEFNETLTVSPGTNPDALVETEPPG